MPELPEVETVKNGIAQFAGKAEIVDVTVRQPAAAFGCAGRL